MGKIFAGLAGGLIVAILGMFLFGVAFAAHLPKSGAAATWIFFGLWIISMLISLFAARPAKAWRRLLILSGIFCLCMPISAFLFTGGELTRQAMNPETGSTIATAGTVLGGGFLMIFTGFLGFFLGAIFLVIGLLSGREKQVVVVKQDPS